MPVDDHVLLQKATEWMLGRGWKRLTAKRRQFEQSLFEHSLVELDAMLQLLPILRDRKHFGLSETEERVLALATVAHDVGKERREWQAYIMGKRGFLSDIDPQLTRTVLPDLSRTLAIEDLDGPVMLVIENCINLHMSHERSDANVVLGMLQGQDRWLTLANLVYHVDNIASAKGLFEAEAALDRSPLRNHLRTSYHLVNMRGVSTTLLHRAALDAFQEMGWTPLLHFSDGTLYVCSASNSAVAEPRQSQIQNRLATLLTETTGRDVTRFMVGSPTANVLPKPDLFDYRELGTYLEAASRKIGRTSFMRKKADVRRAIVVKYLRNKGLLDREPSDVELARHSERISSAHPDMLVLKFFKAAMDKSLIGSTGVGIVGERYDATFGTGAWVALSGTSTLDAARDMAATVDRVWELPGDQFGLETNSVEEANPDRRTQLLISTLATIADDVYGAVPDPPTRTALSGKMAAAFMIDLIHPTPGTDLRAWIQDQAGSYAVSKPQAGKESKNAHRLCPICNTPFVQGTKGKADFVDKPESHTNRGIAHGSFGYIMICMACTFERFLRQILLGERTKELILVLPRMNIGPGAGEMLVSKIRQLFDRAYALMTGDSQDPDRRIWLAFTAAIAGQVHGRDVHELTPEELVDAMSYRSREELRVKNLRELSKVLKEEYGELNAANAEWGTEFDTWDAAIEAVREGTVTDPEVRRLRSDVYRLHPQMELVCQTPHLVILPLAYPIALGKDADTNHALRRVFISLLLGIALDASVAIVEDVDAIDFQGGEGVAYVPPIANARELIGGNWVPIADAERWFRAIGLASILGDAGQYSERTNIFEVLTAPTAGHILRRIEQKRAAEKRVVTVTDIEYLKAYEEVRVGGIESGVEQ